MVEDWDEGTGSEAGSNKEEEEEEDIQEFPAGKAGQEKLGAGSGQLDQILDSISALTSSVALLQVQADIEQQLPQQGARKATTPRQAPMQARQADTTGKRQARIPPQVVPGASL